MNIYITILVEFLLISSIILFLFKFRDKIGLAPLYILLGAVQYIQAFSGTIINFKLFDEFTIYPGSVIIFSAVLFAVLLIYIKEGVASARALIIGIIISNFIISALFEITYLQEFASKGLNGVESSSIFIINYKYFITGTIILLLDFILMVVIYQFLISKTKRLHLFFTIFISLLTVLLFDAVVFNLVLRYDSPNLYNSLIGHIIGKSISALIFSFILYIYLKYMDEEKDNATFIANQNRDIFSIVRYRQRFLDLKAEKMLVEEQLTSKLESSLDNISDGFVSLDSNWCYTYINKKAAEFLGKSPESLIGLNIWTVFHEGVGLPFYKAYYKAVETQQTIYFEDYYEPLDKWFENRIYPSSEGLTIYFTDISEKRKSELALKESENRLRTILETEPECIKQLSANGELIYMNPAGLAMIEADNLEMVKGKSIINLILPEHQKAFKKLNNQIFKGQSGHLQFEIKGLNGTKRWLETHAVPFKDTDGNIISLLGVTRDITNKKLTETALIDNKKYLDNIINNIGDPVFVKDENSVFINANNAFYNLFNRTKEEIIGKAFADDVTQEVREKYLKIDRKVLSEGVENVEEGTIQTNEGELRYISTKKTRFIDESGKKYLIGTIRDITKLKKAEQILTENRNYLDNIINNIGDPLFVKDDQSKIIIVNEAFCKIFNLPKEDIIGKTLAEEVPPEEQEAFMKIDKEVILTGIENVNEETLTVRDGETRYISTKKTRFIDASGNKFLIGTIRDVTERKKTEIELEQHKNSLEELVEIRTEEINKKNNELQRMNKLFVGRELKMKELKNIINELQNKNDR